MIYKIECQYDIIDEEDTKIYLVIGLIKALLSVEQGKEFPIKPIWIKDKNLFWSVIPGSRIEDLEFYDCLINEIKRERDTKIHW